MKVVPSRLKVANEAHERSGVRRRFRVAVRESSRDHQQMGFLAAYDEEDRVRTSLALATWDEPAELHDIACEARKVSGFPIALVSLVLRDIQFFQAHVGLPDPLHVSRCTLRHHSFCQFVVASDETFDLRNCSEVAGLPSRLIEDFGIKSYFGIPINVFGYAIGSLCVISGDPNPEGPSRPDALRQLAGRASEHFSSRTAAGTSTVSDSISRTSLALREAEIREKSSRGLLDAAASGLLNRSQLELAIRALELEPNP